MHTELFRAEHFKTLDLQESQAYLANVFTQQQLLGLETTAAVTIMSDEGRPLACIGTTEIWPGRHSVWAFLSKAPGVAALMRTRAFLLGLRGRIEMTVREGDEAGHRFARALGFELEAASMRGYGIDGASHALYGKEQL